MKRTCPFCKSDLYKNDVYFCTSCEKVLPDELQLKNVSFKNVREVGLPESQISVASRSLKDVVRKVLLTLNLKGLLIGIISGIILSIGFYFLVKYTVPNVSKLSKSIEVEKTLEKAEKESAKPKNIVSLNVTLKSGLLNQKRVVEYVPHDVDFYSEFNSFESLEPYFGFLGGELFTLTETLKDKVQPYYSAFSVNRGEKNSWVFILFPLEVEITHGTYKSLIVEKIKEVLVISTDKNLVDEVKSAKEGVSKSLGLNPAFVSIKSSLPVEGKAFIFVPTEKGRGVAQELLGKTTSDELKLIMDAFKAQDSNYLVVK